jgi:acetyl esterase/lipase
MRYLKFYFFILFFNNLNTYVIAQLPYALNQYAYDSLINVSYGQDIDYAGNPVDLVLDIYKPKLDSNCLRPIVVLVHGGAWFAGSKEDVFM